MVLAGRSHFLLDCIVVESVMADRQVQWRRCTFQMDCVRFLCLVLPGVQRSPQKCLHEVSQECSQAPLAKHLFDHLHDYSSGNLQEHAHGVLCGVPTKIFSSAHRTTHWSMHMVLTRIARTCMSFIRRFTGRLLALWTRALI